MSIENREYYKWSDEYDRQREAHRNVALNEFYDKIQELTLKVEHDVPLNMEGEGVYTLNPRITSTIDKVLDLGDYFVYETELEGRFGEYTESFDYNFSDQAKEHLADTLGYYKEAGE